MQFHIMYALKSYFVIISISRISYQIAKADNRFEKIVEISAGYNNRFITLFIESNQ